jgi:hypothetical protein
MATKKHFFGHGTFLIKDGSEIRFQFAFWPLTNELPHASIAWVWDCPRLPTWTTTYFLFAL